MLKVKKARLSKKTNRRLNFKKFVDSGYSDMKLFLKACKDDENLLIYTCLEQDELQDIINKMKNFDTLDEQIAYLVANQPIMNKTEKRFDKVVESLYAYLKGYIDYNAFRLSNSTNSAEDWSAELWEKYCKICDFYRTRWFYPEKFINPETGESKTKVTFTPMQYKEFIYIVRLSISSERKHRAFLAAMHPEDTIFKISLNGKIDVGNDEKSLAEVVPDETTSSETLVESSNANRIIDKALYIAKQYPDAAEVLDQIKTYYEIQDTEVITNLETKEHIYLDKKIVVLGKIFLYKAGLVSPKVLAFIKALSPTYKQRYNISNARINTQLSEYKAKKPVQKQKKVNKKELTYKELILRKRGEL